ncbi:MAG: nuclear transport factor 2 family protein [Bryobacterales bacterium]|nr:nuclear transport factor 2 family protein [Bryobacterales bacterium]
MKVARLFLLMGLACVAVTGVLAADAKSEVLAVMRMQQEAWNRGDLDGFMEGYEKSAAITFVGKTVARGYDGLVERYRRTYGDREKMGTLSFSELEFRPLGEESAFLIGRFELKRSEAGGGDASGRFTVVFQKSEKGWRIVHDHTSAD